MKTVLPLVVVLLLPVVALAADKPKGKTKAGPKKLEPGAVDVTMPFPPSVLTGDGELICNISDKENGHQKLTITYGGGLEFDVAVSTEGGNGIVTSTAPGFSFFGPAFVLPLG